MGALTIRKELTILSIASVCGSTERKSKTVVRRYETTSLITKALVHEPKLILLDEPTAGVDIELRSSLWDFVVELKKA